MADFSPRHEVFEDALQHDPMSLSVQMRYSLTTQPQLVLTTASALNSSVWFYWPPQRNSRLVLIPNSPSAPRQLQTPRQHSLHWHLTLLVLPLLLHHRMAGPRSRPCAPPPSLHCQEYLHPDLPVLHQLHCQVHWMAALCSRQCALPLSQHEQVHLFRAFRV